MSAIPVGYKQTEVGVIPEDWDAVALSSLGQFKNGINKGSEAFGHGSPFINLMDVFGVSSITSGEALGLVDTSGTEQKTYDLKRGDVIFIRSSVKPSGVGLTAVVEADLPQTVYSGFLIRFRDDGVLDIGFKRHCFYSAAFRNKLIGASSVSANTNINQDNLKRLLLALPPTIAEQRAIATALSDVDALLAKLDQFIAKKRDLKQAAMQQLLTGQTRLPGFSGEWEEKPVTSFSAFVTKGATPTTYGFNWEDDGVVFLRSECVSTDGLDLTQSMFISEAAHATLARGEVRSGDILITITGNVGRVVRLSPDFGIANINQHIARIRVKDPDVSSVFVFHWLSQASVRANYALITTGQAYPQISLKQVRETMVPLPPFAEQTAIATVLSDMDAELAALEARRNKTRALKQGMMQELLTGRIRLV